MSSKILSLQDDNDFFYLIGLICTDGNVTWKGKVPSASCDRCTISQATKNNKLLYAIKKKFGGIVVNENNRPHSVWATLDSEFVSFLRHTVGIGENKTFDLDIATWFNTLTDIQKRHFLRGVIDGDGNVFFDKKRDRHHKISIFTASKKFAELMSCYFDNCKIYIQKPRPNTWSKHIGYNICFTGTKCMKKFSPILTTVAETSIYLKYKYNTFKKLQKRYGYV